MMRRRQGQLEPPADGGAARINGDSIAQSTNQATRQDPPDHCQYDPSVTEARNRRPNRENGRDPSVVNQATRPSKTRNSSWSAAAMRSAMRLSQENYHQARDPSVVNEKAVTINRSTSRDPPPETRESNSQPSHPQQDLYEKRDDHTGKSVTANRSAPHSLGLPPSGSHSSTVGSSSNGSPNSQQRAFLRNFLKKKGEKPSAPGKTMATAKQKLLRNVLQKSQGGALMINPSADEMHIYPSDSNSPNNGTLREKWKRVAAANASRMGKRTINDPLKENNDAHDHQRQITNTNLRIDPGVPRGAQTEITGKSHEMNKQVKVSSSGLSIRQRYEETRREKAFEKLVEDESKDVHTELDDEYREFLDILHEEVLGQHAQLWENFRSTLTNTPAATVELKSPSHPFKFDSETKQILMQMNLYLKNVSTVEHLGVTQLVKDKKFRKEQSRLSMLVGGSVDNSRRSSVLPPILAERVEKRKVGVPQGILNGSATRGKEERQGENASHFDVVQVGRRSSLSRQGHHAVTESRYLVSEDVDERSFTKTSEVSVIHSAPSDDSSVSLNRYDVPPPPEREYDHVTAQRSNDDNENEQQVENRKSDTILSTRSLSSVFSNESSQRTPMETTKNHSPFTGNGIHGPKHQNYISRHHQHAGVKKSMNIATPKSDSGFEVTLGQFESKMLPSCPNSVRSASTSGSVPSWKDVRLKSVASCSPENQSDIPKSSPAFAQLQLRRVETSTPSPSSTATESHLLYSLDSQSFVFNESANFISPSNPKQAHPEPADPADRTPPIQNSKQPCQKKIDSESNFSFDSTVANSVETCIHLRSDGGNVAKLFVSKERIRKTYQASEDSPLQLVWVLERSMIKSLSLDMADNQANLVLNKGEKPETLAFGTAEDCLRFANCFYEFSAPSTLRSSDSEIPNSVNQQEEEDDEVSLLDTLNDEEQKVLEMYRRLRKTKAAEDAMQESISQESVRADDQLSLTSQEEEQAERYRGMLRMSFPLAVVKHKMTRDGVNSRVFAEIEAAANDSPPIFVSAQRLPGSPISTFSSSCGLSTDQETAEAYRKLFDKLGNADSIRKQMDDAKIDPKIVALVLGEADSTAESSLTSADQALVEGYKKMLKMSVPEQAVRHKMLKDGASEAVSRAVFGNAKQENPRANDLSTEESAIVDKFKKMISMGVPKDGVRHKMIREQVSQKVMDVVLEISSESKSSDSNVPPPPASQDKQLTDDEMSLVSQYKRMLKLQIPRDQVLSRMQKEGVAEKIITAVMGKRIGSSESTRTVDSKASEGTSSNLVSLHWTPISGKDLDDSVWSRTSKKHGVSTKIAGPEKTEFNELMELFQKKANTGKIRSARKKDTGNGSEKAKLLDITRSNNVAISLKAFKSFPFEELAEIISFLDPLRKIRGEKCQFIRDILPTSSEIRIVKEYDGSDERLEPAELWFRQLVDIPRIEVKAQILRTMEMFNSEATLLMDSFALLDEVCRQVMKSEKLQELLEMVLNIGNIMNEGTRTGGASGFKFDSLLKLTQTKSSDGTTTVLDFLVNVFVSKNQREVLDLTSDFPRCRMASKMMISDLLKEVKNLGDSLEQCKEELETLIKEDEKDDESEDDVVDLTAVNSSDLDDPRSALLSALKARGSTVPKKPKRFAQRDLFLAVVEEKKPKDKEVLDENMMNREAGMNRLRRFIAEETETYACLIQKRDQALEACRNTSKYCGEGGGHGSTAPLLGVLAQFADNLEEAVKKYDQKTKRSKKQQTSDQSSCANSVQTSATGQTEAKNAKRSLILMVNEMLKDATERTKEDFTKGRVYGNPSKSLQAIYELESVVVASEKTHIEEDNGVVSTAKGIEKKQEQGTPMKSQATEGATPKKAIDVHVQAPQIGQASISTSIADFWKKKEATAMQQSLIDGNADTTPKKGNPAVSSDLEAQSNEDTHLVGGQCSSSNSPKRLPSVADAVRMFGGVKEKVSHVENRVEGTGHSSLQLEIVSPAQETSAEESPDNKEDTLVKASLNSSVHEDIAANQAIVDPNEADLVSAHSKDNKQADGQDEAPVTLALEQKENVISQVPGHRLSHGNERTPETKAQLGDHQQTGDVLRTVHGPNTPIGSPTPGPDKGESTMTRLARLKREEKAKTRKSVSESPHATTKSPLPSSSQESQAQQESAMVQLARQMRKDRRLSSNKQGSS